MVLHPGGLETLAGCISLRPTLPSGYTFKLVSLFLGLKEGILWKRGRDNGQFLPRKFILSEKDGCLKYFIKQDVSMACLNG